MILKTTLIVLLTIGLFSCQKDSSAVSYLIFGHFYGECWGEQCVEIFRLKDGQLSEDRNDDYPSGSSRYEGNYRRLSHSLYKKVQDLYAQVPIDLLKEERTIIGQPDAGDWGGLYIEYAGDDQRRFWLLDQKKDNIPNDLWGFVDLVSAKIKIINN